MVRSLRLSTVGMAILLFSILATGGAASAASAPLDVIRNGTERVLKLIRENCKSGETVKVQEHRAEILDIVYDYFDFEEMGKRALGRHWKQQDPAKQKEYTKLFEELLFNTYLDRVDTYTCGNEAVKFDENRVEGNYALVKTRVVGYRDTEVAVEYRMKLRDDQWKVYDVVVEGISLVGNYRSQFDSILSKGSFDDLLSRLREKRIPAPKAG